MSHLGPRHGALAASRLHGVVSPVRRHLVTAGTYRALAVDVVGDVDVDADAGVGSGLQQAGDGGKRGGGRGGHVFRAAAHLRL